MKISWEWLKQHIALPAEPGELVPRLQSLGLEVSSIERLGPSFSGVVAAEILEIGKHPNADRLSLCRVSDGSATYSVVCGATNIAVGQRVPLARLGATLPGGKIEAAKIRGVESQGMLCSTAELGTNGDAAGILILDPAVALGRNVAELFGSGDSVLDVEVTPNRPDCLSHHGLARELAAALGIPVKSRPIDSLHAQGDCPWVEVADSKACPRYLGRLLSEVQVGPSPGWLAARLTAVGLRPINNIVDVTNYVLMDLGQPLHAFDFDKIEGGKIAVRWARPAESIAALDGRDYELDGGCLVIADTKRPVAVAGVMGGSQSAVCAATRRVFLESANFAPGVVRRSSRKLGLRSDSSYRFERGCDPASVPDASNLAISLIRQASRKPVRASQPFDLYPRPEKPTPIRIAASRINEILGSSLSNGEVESKLAAVCVVSQERDELVVTPPSHRRDLATAWDLAEETARLVGFENLPATVPTVTLRPRAVLASARATTWARARLIGAGLFETYSYDFVSAAELETAAWPPSLRVSLANPITEEWTHLRPSLLFGLLKATARNLNAQADSVRLFEIGSVFIHKAQKIVEAHCVAGAIAGLTAPVHWSRPLSPAGFFDAKFAALELLFGFKGLNWAPIEGALAGIFHPKACGSLRLGESTIGAAGLIDPKLARLYGIKQPIASFEIDLAPIKAARRVPPHFKPFGAFPTAWRDVCVIVGEGLPYIDLEESIVGLNIPELRHVELIAVYTGKGVPKGQRSLTWRLVFGRPDRTLTDDEVNAAIARILKTLEERFQARLRS